MPRSTLLGRIELVLPELDRGAMDFKHQGESLAAGGGTCFEG